MRRARASDHLNMRGSPARTRTWGSDSRYSYRCFAASLIAVANAAVPPKTIVKTGFSLSTMRLQTRFTGRITSGLNRNELTKITDKENLNKLAIIEEA